MCVLCILYSLLSRPTNALYIYILIIFYISYAPLHVSVHLHHLQGVLNFRSLILIISLTLREERRLRVFENRVLRRVCGPKKDKVTGEWRKLHNEEISDLYSLPNIVRVVKSRRMRWTGHVARMGEGRGVHRVLVGKPEGKRPLGDPDEGGRIILRWIFKKWKGVVRTG